MSLKRMSPAVKRQGFSLVEVLVAILVIAIAMGVLGYLITALRNTASSDESTAAANFSRRYIDVLRSRWQIPAEYKRGGDLGKPPVSLSLSNPPAMFNEYSLTIENIDTKTPPNVIQSRTFNYNRGGNMTVTYNQPAFTDDILRRVTIRVKGRDGEYLTPFVTEIVAPTVTR